MVKDSVSIFSKIDYLNLNLLDILEFIKNFMIGDLWRSLLIFLVILIIVYLKYGDSLERLFSIFGKLLSFTGKGAKRFYTTHDLQSKLNVASKKLEKELVELPQKKIKIKWVKDIDRKSFIKNNKMVIKLNYDKNVNDNFIRLSLCYTKNSIVPQVRPYMNEDLSDSLDYYYTKKIINFEERKDTLDYYIRYYLVNRIGKSDNSKEYFKKIENIDKVGNLSRIYLKEIISIPRKYFPDRIQDKALIEEMVKLLGFLYEISTKETDMDVPLEYYSSEFKINVILIARSSTKEKGMWPYIKRISGILKKDPKSIYFLAKGANIRFAKDIVNYAIHKFDLSKIYEDTFSLLNRSNAKAFCVLLKNKKPEQDVQA
ncbi:MAG: hypothetical protein KAW56_00325 [Candidatus Marinimicrobia bacterium]|nr:hypothetical protein [Candidatus Neomarinimicrobiota bacterium]MCK4445505.1 hypothetical protein [Candidatus Neomarinimicrobiota bacterium]